MYASVDALIFPFGKEVKAKQVAWEVRTVLQAKDKRTSLLRMFFREFLRREPV
jgi:hypothetical protein